MNLSQVTLQWFPLLPVWLIVVLAAALTAVLVFGSWLLRKKSIPRRWITAFAVLRVGMIVVFTLALLRPVVTLPRQTTLAPDLVVLVDTSESMSLPSGADAATRLDAARAVLKDSPALQAAGRTHALHWFAFDQRAYPLDAAALQQAEAKGTTTDIAGSLASAYQHVRLLNAAAGTNGVPTRALVVSDGQNQGTGDAVAVARELGLTVDVLAPPAGQGQTQQPVTIADVQSARRVLLGSETAFQVTLRADARADGLELALEEDGKEVERRKLAELPAGHETRLVLTHHPAEPGLKRYVLKLLRGGTAVGQPRAVNVQVTDQRHDVLVLEDTWRWEFKYLRRLLEDDPSFSFTALLSRGGSAFVQFGEPERRVQLGGFPRSRSELDGFDTLILGNVNPQNWPRGFARNVRNTVIDGGKSLVVIAGPDLGRWVDVPELMQLLPVELNRESGTPVPGSVDLRVTPEGEASSLFVMAAGNADEAGSGVDAKLPPVEQVYPAVRKRPAATVLLEAAGQTNPYGPLIVMAEQTVGRGRVLFIGTDTLWRWQTLGPRNEAGVTLYSAFWQQALRALAPAEPTTSPTMLWLHPERTQYRAGERVKLTAEWHAPEGETGQVVTAAVVLPDNRRLPLDLVPDEHDPSRLAGQFDVTAAGQYRVEATARTEARVLADMAAMIEVIPRPGEKDDAPVNAAALQRLAAATGGRVIDPTAPDGWLPAKPPEPVTIVRRQSYDLWRNFSLLLLLSGFLAADWSLRLFRGYV